MSQQKIRSSRLGMTSDETLHFACRRLTDRQTNFRNKSRKRYTVSFVFAGMPMMEIPKRYQFAWD